MWKKFSFLLVLVLVASACGGGSESADSSLPLPETSAATTALPGTTAPPSTDATPQRTTTPSPPPPESTTAPGAFPVTVAGTEIPARPARIVSMSSTSTEMLFAIGAGPQVVAVDSLSNFPPEAPLTDLNAFEPSVEAIAAFEPDLVVIFSDPGDFASGLETLGIPVIRHVAPVGIEEVYDQIDELGRATGNGEGADLLIEDLRRRIDEAVASFGIVAPDEPITYYHEIDNTLYSATSATFIGSIYSLFGLVNIADAADTIGSGFPQLNPEYIVEADPDIIFFGCAVWCGTSVESISQRPGWGGLSAVERGAMVELDDDLTSRWGPRIVQFVEGVGASLERLLAADGTG